MPTITIAENLHFYTAQNLQFKAALDKEYTDRLLAMAQLPLVLTNTDLKRLFQISDSTLNRLVKLGDFPTCWYGIRGHYLRDDVLEWMRKSDADGFREQMRLLRSF
ncbi:MULTISPECIES: helix-turn-helix domain-containing protein [Enterococcus]|uniref:helix-turn-helix domain-containing protein n=1 Tax=Enterococcus faecium TaxID=1352 RepID=UPI001F517FFA|nr:MULTISPECIES: helix-turn-helix domain-containing protein [Enterococcus]